ncbi:MAG: hypothetical protein ABIX46_02335 [Burkholderiaceae bacterium]
MNMPDPALQSADPAVHAADAVLTDYADLGTAFGLDASVASAIASSASASASVDPAASAAPPWEHRLTRRTGL